MSLLWKSITQLSQTQFGWKDDSDINGVDPYAVWADATAFHGMGPIELKQGVPLLIELTLSGAAPSSQAQARAQPTPEASALLSRPHAPFSLWEQLNRELGIEMLRAYKPVLEAGGSQFTVHAMVPGALVPKMKGWWPVPSVGRLGVRALMSLPRISPKWDNVRVLDTSVLNADPTVAVIDDGCPFANVKFRYLNQGKWKSRVAYLWDQSRSRANDDPVNWKTPDGFGYGREVVQQDIEGFLQANTDAATLEVDEDACYSTARYESVNRRWTHGTAITDVAAGSPDPIAQPQSPADAAATAPIIFVQLPRGAVEDPSGGGLPGYVVDALRYIEARTKDSKGVQHPVAINLSYGTFAGPHDGTSPVEVAIDSFLSGRKDCAVMVSAGNAYDAQIHAETRIAPNDCKTLRWRVPPGDDTHNFMEIWLPPGDDAGGAPVVDVRLVPPAGLAPASPLTGAGQGWFGVPDDSPLGLPICAVIHPTTAPQGTNGSMALLAVAATEGDASITAVAPSGTWEVEIHNQGNAPLTVHAWVERDDPSFQLSKQSRFEDPTLEYLKSTSTLGSFSHAAQAIVVGACVDDLDSGRPVSPYSSAGPSRLPNARIGPDFAAGADESLMLAGLRAAATHSADTIRLGGTSIAAAVVTRHVVNEVLSKSTGNSPSQIKAKLTYAPRASSEGPERVGVGRIKSLQP
ncbi:S8 family serine peptidase [Variovorax sp. J31P207]|uniref:S8 family serine peptidase n=1 Tax=Variovorax sp. J31P207 TaxID=3053510 RepID=UPI00257557BE|nr:S8 family serine peptidase [Variovorax sp. J31P207]MDM0064986.1 hypothetical protein [Variovorax sp. J31P207]